MQEVARNLAAVIRDVDKEVEDCEAQSGAFKTVLDGVADDTTVASEILEIEEKQRDLNACRSRLEPAIKALQKELGMRAIGQVMEFDGSKYVSGPPPPTPPPTPAPPRPPAETYGGVVDAAVKDGILTADEAGPVSDWLAAGGGSFFQQKVNVTSQFQKDVVVKGKVTKTDPEQIWKSKGDQIIKSGLDAGVITSDEAEGYVAEFGGCGAARTPVSTTTTCTTTWTRPRSVTASATGPSQAGSRTGTTIPGTSAICRRCRRTTPASTWRTTTITTGLSP